MASGRRSRDSLLHRKVAGTLRVRIPHTECAGYRVPMLPRDILRQVRRLHLRARRAVQDLLGGEYRSVFKGLGIAFEEVREYQPGDDIRTIDWNVTARMGHPFI